VTQPDFAVVGGDLLGRLLVWRAAIDPVRMATAFASATRAGRLGYLSGPMAVQDLAVASTPKIGQTVLQRGVSKETA
jgi:hypothetical protein